jgi:tripartite-type tricarboxylate transporter receptor subunit TctC
MSYQRLALCVVCLAVSIWAPGVVAADPAATFNGKTITVYVSHPPGGGYDLYGRILARHLGRNLPGNPTVVASNMPGAQGALAANFMYHSAPRDGTAVAILNQDVVSHQVLRTQGVQFDAAKFNWVGRIAANVETFYVWHNVPINSINDLRERQTIFASNGPSIPFYLNTLSALTGARFKIVRGYAGTQDTHLALERGEVEGMLSSLNTIMATRPDWLRANKVRFILQLALQRQPKLAGVPALLELVQSSEDRELAEFVSSSGTIGRSFVAPPDMLPERIAALRAGFDATMRDEQFLSEVRQTNVELSPLSGTALQRTVARALDMEPDKRERIRALWTRQ